MKAKFKDENLFIGKVGQNEIQMKGKTKREATMRLRKAFASAGCPTIRGTQAEGAAPARHPAFVDLLEVRCG